MFVEKSEFMDLIKGIFITELLIAKVTGSNLCLGTFCEKGRARAV